MTTINYRVEIFPEGNLYVAQCPDLGVSSFGDTVDEARDSLQEAVEAFLEGCEMLGTLDVVLTESGFSNADGTWRSEQPTDEEVTLAMLFSAAI